MKKCDLTHIFGGEVRKEWGFYTPPLFLEIMLIHGFCATIEEAMKDLGIDVLFWRQINEASKSAATSAA